MGDVGKQRRWSTVGLLVALLASCGTDKGEPRASDAEQKAEQRAERMYAVAADPNATANDIITAGMPMHVAVSQGAVLIVYQVTSDDDEGPGQAAWRLYAKDGSTVADGEPVRSAMEGPPALGVTGLTDGFLVTGTYDAQAPPSGSRVSTSGEITPANVSNRPLPTAAGDVVSPASDRWFYRPADNSFHALPRVPGGWRDVQRLTLAPDGSVWAISTWTRSHLPVLISRDGQPPWRDAGFDQPRGHYPAAEIFVGSRLAVLPLGGIVNGREQSKVTMTRSSQTESVAPWAPIDISDLQLVEWIEPAFLELPDGRIAFEGTHDAWLIADPSFTERADLHLPSDGAWTLATDGTVVVAIDRNVAGGVFESSDSTATWQPLT